MTKAEQELLELCKEMLNTISRDAYSYALRIESIEKNIGIDHPAAAVPEDKKSEGTATDDKPVPTRVAFRETGQKGNVLF